MADNHLSLWTIFFPDIQNIFIQFYSLASCFALLMQLAKLSAEIILLPISDTFQIVLSNLTFHRSDHGKADCFLQFVSVLVEIFFDLFKSHILKIGIERYGSSKQCISD